MADQWHYSVNGEKKGPISSGELKQLASAGKLSRSDLIWKEGMANWVPAGKVKGLLPVQETSTPPRISNGINFAILWINNYLNSIDDVKDKIFVQRLIDLTAIICTGLGALLVLISMFLPRLSLHYSNEQLFHNLMIQNNPFTLLVVLAAIASIIGYWRKRLSTTSKVFKHASNLAFYVGLWFFIVTTYDASNAIGELERSREYYNETYLERINSRTHADSGLWTAGVGCVLVSLGGIVMKTPRIIIANEEIAQISKSKPCPFCAEIIKSEAKVCRFCHKDLNS